MHPDDVRQWFKGEVSDELVQLRLAALHTDREVNHPLIGCYLDTGNMLLYGYAEHWVPLVGRHLRQVHVKDFKRGSGGGHFCQLLDGDCNYPAVMRELRALGYDGYLTSEVSAAERGPGGSIAETAARLRQIIAL